ncbi:MAG: hypothetical protein MJ157_05570, partial [Clostridia bacterium]|nr:hypothetical protein [Clostridia bacterium]
GQLAATLVGRQPLDLAVDSLAGELRLGRAAVLGVVRDNHLWLDLRTILPEEEALLSQALANLLL